MNVCRSSRFTFHSFSCVDVSPATALFQEIFKAFDFACLGAGSVSRVVSPGFPFRQQHRPPIITIRSTKRHKEAVKQPLIGGVHVDDRQDSGKFRNYRPVLQLGAMSDSSVGVREVNCNLRTLPAIMQRGARRQMPDQIKPLCGRSTAGCVFCRASL